MKRESKGKRPSFYDDPSLDQMMSMLLTLAQEVSVLADELDATHRVLAKHGIDTRTEIASLKFDQGALDERETRRQEMLRRLFYLVRKDAAEAAGQETLSSYNAALDEIGAA